MTTTKLAPIHPGEILREEFMQPRALSQNALARYEKERQIEREVEPMTAMQAGAGQASFFRAGCG